mmetsp:Transcript_40490/g.41062  ORF Transcript_40490/g.41062 Transcript_40490/m.41062 type:complete len:129 (+) Transcript_40490:117-503(+)
MTTHGDNNDDDHRIQPSHKQNRWILPDQGLTDATTSQPMHLNWKNSMASSALTCLACSPGEATKATAVSLSSHWFSVCPHTAQHAFSMCVLWHVQLSQSQCMGEELCGPQHACVLVCGWFTLSPTCGA